MIGSLRRIAKAHGAEPAQIALAWLIHRPNVVVIPGASSVGQLEQNVAAADIELSVDEDQELTAAAESFSPLHGAGAFAGIVRKRMIH
jgi:aryl-alcohol dehydrogenase-like predicted oxidoreductase